jgi:hypothetical protein
MGQNKAMTRVPLQEGKIKSMYDPPKRPSYNYITYEYVSKKFLKRHTLKVSIPRYNFNLVRDLI